MNIGILIKIVGDLIMVYSFYLIIKCFLKPQDKISDKDMMIFSKGLLLLGTGAGTYLLGVDLLFNDTYGALAKFCFIIVFLIPLFLVRINGREK